MKKPHIFPQAYKALPAMAPVCFLSFNARLKCSILGSHIKPLALTQINHAPHSVTSGLSLRVFSLENTLLPLVFSTSEKCPSRHFRLPQPCRVLRALVLSSYSICSIIRISPGICAPRGRSLYPTARSCWTCRLRAQILASDTLDLALDSLLTAGNLGKLFKFSGLLFPHL